jgi:heat shock protein HtpX
MARRRTEEVFTDGLSHITQVADPSHLIKLANSKLDECRRRTQNESLGHRGRKNDPLYRARRLLTKAHERPDDLGDTKLRGLLAVGDPTARSGWPGVGSLLAGPRRLTGPGRRHAGRPDSGMLGGVLVHEVVRRNCRRAAVMALVTGVNYWATSCLLVGAAAYVALDFGSERWDRQLVTLPVWAALTVAPATLVAGGLLAEVVRSLRARTLRAVGAVELRPGELPRVQGLVSELSLAVGTPPPDVALVADPAPNVLAVGHRPSRTTVVVTSGLVEALTRDELEAVLAVEMCAIGRRDTALQSVALACTGGPLTIHGWLRMGVDRSQPWYYRWDWSAWIMLAAIWPTMACARRLRRAALRAGDFGPDTMAVAITRHPEALVRALRKLIDDPRVVAGENLGATPLWLEPTPAEADSFDGIRLPALRPSLAERLTRIQALAGLPA